MMFALSGAKQLEGELSGVVRAVGRFTAVVTLPPVGEIGDMDTYDPVSPEKKVELAETTLLFPRKLGGGPPRAARRPAQRGVRRGLRRHRPRHRRDGRVLRGRLPRCRTRPDARPGSAAIAVAADPRTTPPPAIRSSCGGTIPSRNTSQPGNYAGRRRRRHRRARRVGRRTPDRRGRIPDRDAPGAAGGPRVRLPAAERGRDDGIGGRRGGERPRREHRRRRRHRRRRGPAGRGFRPADPAARVHVRCRRPRVPSSVARTRSAGSRRLPREESGRHLRTGRQRGADSEIGDSDTDDTDRHTDDTGTDKTPRNVDRAQRS